MSLQIKEAEASDIKILAELFDAYRVFYKQETNMEAAANFLQARMTKKESKIFIAFVDGVAAGFTQLYPIFSSVRMGRAWLLNDLYVAADFRKQGIATALLDKAKEYGTASNAKWLMLQTGADNYTAQSVYEGNGWKRDTDFVYTVSC